MQPITGDHRARRDPRRDAPAIGLRRATLLGVIGCICLGTATARGATPPSGNAIELDEIRVRGNTVLPATEIEEAVYPFLGPDKTTADVEHARDALALVYQRHGFQAVTVSIPPQHVTEGVVYLTVNEQPIARLRVIGAQYVEPAVLKRQAPALQPGKVVDFNALKRDVARLNRLPDRTVTPAFRPGRLPNTTDVDLSVQDSLPLHGTLELNNRRSVDTTSLRLNGSLSYDNFFQRGDTGTLFFQVAPQNTADARVVGGSYLFHVPSSIMALLLSYTDSDSDVNTLGDLDVLGKGKIASAQLQIPLDLTDGFVQNVTVGISYKHLDEDVRLGANSATPSANAYPVTYYPVTIGYEGDWIGARAQTSLNAGITLGLRGQSSSDFTFGNKRTYSNSNFAYLRANLTRTQDLPHDVQLYGSLSAQASADALLTTEQLSLGGIDTVRGYLESDALGDQGVALQTELRSPSVAGVLGHHVQSWRFHLFADTGNVSIHRALLEQASSYTLSSAGIGTRITLFGYLNASLEEAFLLSRGPNAHAGDHRFLFRLYGSF